MTQGLAFGAGLPVLPLDSLALVAEDAAHQHGAAAQRLWVAVDARMDEVYAAAYRRVDGHWQATHEPALWPVAALAQAWLQEPPACVAGTALDAFGERLPSGNALRVARPHDRGAALARLARAAWQRGAAVDAAQALPLYLRDKVALTTVDARSQSRRHERRAPHERSPESQPGRGLRATAPMTIDDLDAVLVIERQAYDFPWTRGNFVDSLAAGYLGRLLRDGRGEALAYYVAMAGVQEMHLLNLTVAPAWQRRGLSLRLLADLVESARAADAQSLWLEVRVSNTRAAAIYRRYGFDDMGMRRGYYPAGHGAREDAQVMRLLLTPTRATDALE